MAIDALDVTILKGGGDEVGRWAQDNGLTLTPDFPEVLDFYTARSPIFMTARYDVSRARDAGQEIGSGTPVHLTIPTDNPWVPLRVLGAGAAPEDRIEADLFLLTDREPALLPASRSGLERTTSEPASDLLLDDLRPTRTPRGFRRTPGSPTCGSTCPLVTWISTWRWTRGAPGSRRRSTRGSRRHSATCRRQRNALPAARSRQASSCWPPGWRWPPAPPSCRGNRDPIAHELIAGDLETQQGHETGADRHHDGAHGAVTVGPGATAETTHVFTDAGAHWIGCHHPGHWDHGMRLPVQVTR